MLKFYRKVSPKENLLGMYITQKDLDDKGITVLDYYKEMFVNQEKKRVPIQSPLVMLVDPTLTDNRLSIKIIGIVSTKIPGCPVFCEY